jgi:hypothetical protein
MPSPLPNQWILTWGLGHLVRFILKTLILTLILITVDVIRSVSDSEPSPPSVAQTAGPSGGPEAHESMIIYHPNSGRATEAQLLDGPSRKTNPPRNLEPWSPFFKSREDFEISEVIMKVGMSKSDCDRVFKAIRRCLDGKGSFNLKKYSDARSAWNAYRLS